MLPQLLSKYREKAPGGRGKPLNPPGIWKVMGTLVKKRMALSR